MHARARANPGETPPPYLSRKNGEESFPALHGPKDRFLDATVKPGVPREGALKCGVTNYFVPPALMIFITDKKHKFKLKKSAYMLIDSEICYTFAQ